MKPKLDIDKIAKDIGAKRIGKIHASGGYFGARPCQGWGRHL
jgi:hypothetical protein